MNESVNKYHNCTHKRKLLEVRCALLVTHPAFSPLPPFLTETVCGLGITLVLPSDTPRIPAQGASMNHVNQSEPSTPWPLFLVQMEGKDFSGTEEQVGMSLE